LRTKRLKWVAAIRVSNVDKKSADDELPVRLCNYTDVYYNERITSDLEFMAATATRGQHMAFSLQAGDVVLTKDSETADDIGVSALIAEDVADLVCGYHLAIVRPRAEVTYGPYLRWVLASDAARQAMSMAATGVTRFGLRSETIADLDVPMRPLEEQRVIADYLDRETARIDALISAKQRAILLYRERRQSLRDNAFDSVPGFRLKHLLREGMAYGVLVPEFVEDGARVPMIRTYNLTARGDVDREDIAEIPLSLANQYRRTCLEEGDLILSVVGSMGRAAVAGPREVGSNLNRPLARLQPKAELGPRLLWHWTQTTHFMDSAMLATGGGTAQPTLNLGDLANFHVGLPADERPWRQILSMLETGCRKLDRLEDTASSQTALLYERRQALITAAVTGQIDVSVPA
jgi:type I restriction enzyme, S subunit